MFKPRTVFNLSLDTLYIGLIVQDQVLHLVASLGINELAGLQNLAIFFNLNFDYESCEETEIDYIQAIKKATKSMSSLKKFQYVYDLTDWLFEETIEEGTGPMQLFNKWPVQVERMHMCRWQYDGDCGCCPSDCESSNYECEHDFEHDCCEFHELPNHHPKHLWDDPKAASVASIWGWRPTK
jgi:hypothetical protein